MRNFGILNIIFFFPTLDDQYIAGPFDVIRIKNPIKAMGIVNSSPLIKAKIKFIDLFTIY